MAPEENSRSSEKSFAAFARIYSAGMVPIFDKGQSWPGFSYTEQEQAAMREQVARFPNATAHFLYFAFGVMAPITIALFVIPVLMMAWVLIALEHAHGKFPPETVFFAIFGATMAVNLAVMLPLGYYLSCMFYGRRMEPALADSQFGRRLFFKFCRQTARVAIIAGIGFFLLSLWPTKPSTSPETKGVGSRPFNFWQRSGVPLVAILIKLGILRYYYRKSGQLENQLTTSDPSSARRCGLHS